MVVWDTIVVFMENWQQHLLVICCTLAMFVLQRQRARRIFRLQRETAVVFTRYPEAGRTKTRLKAGLSDKGAARVQMLMTDHIVNRLIDHQRDHRDLAIDVCYSGGTEERVATWFGRRAESCPGSVTWHPQRGEDLGQKMRNAIIRHITQGEDRVVIVGSDIPSITGEDVQEAMGYLLQEDSYDMVLGEALDGGYYLVGLNAGGAAQVHELFEDIPWGTDQVYKLQFAKALKLGLRLRVLQKRYNDVDTPDDIPMMIQQLNLTRGDIFFPRWSVIIPTYNEGANITTTLRTVTQRCGSADKIDIIVVDGGSTDDTQQRVLQFAKMSEVTVTLAESQKGRGHQCIVGAKMATGFYLLFLHADTLVPENFTTKAEELLLTPGISAGAFRFGVDAVHDEEKRKTHSRIFVWKMQKIETFANLRAHYKELPYGDQGLFMTRPTYHMVGGFPAWPLLEDVHIVEKLQTQGLVSLVPGDPMIASSRRWEKYGAVKVTLINTTILVAYNIFHVSPERLALWYYGKPKTD